VFLAGVAQKCGSTTWAGSSRRICSSFEHCSDYSAQRLLKMDVTATS